MFKAVVMAARQVPWGLAVDTKRYHGDAALA